jgi:hypothetical protein
MPWKVIWCPMKQPNSALTPGRPLYGTPGSPAKPHLDLALPKNVHLISHVVPSDTGKGLCVKAHWFGVRLLTLSTVPCSALQPLVTWGNPGSGLAPGLIVRIEWSGLDVCWCCDSTVKQFLSSFCVSHWQGHCWGGWGERVTVSLATKTASRT